MERLQSHRTAQPVEKGGEAEQVRIAEAMVAPEALGEPVGPGVGVEQEELVVIPPFEATATGVMVAMVGPVRRVAMVATGELVGPVGPVAREVRVAKG